MRLNSSEQRPPEESLRVLIVSFVFPPHNVIGAVRVGKTAKYLLRLGHDVRVVTGADLPLKRTLALEIPPSHIEYTRWIDVDAPYQGALAMRNRIRALARRVLLPAAGLRDAGTKARVGSKRSIAEHIRLLYTDLLHLPDYAIGWYPFGLRVAHKLALRWQPDVILASGAPWTSFLIARRLSHLISVPWVADLRDPWAGNPYLRGSAVRTRIVDPWYERHILRTAGALITVTEPLAAKLRARYPKIPVQVVLNGFDADDYPDIGYGDMPGPTDSVLHVAEQPDSAHRSGVLRLVYTGQISRRMEPLLDAVTSLGSEARFVRLEIVGVLDPEIRERYAALAASRGIADQVKWLAPVSHSEAALIQRTADVLFMFIDDTPYDAGIYTGKLFEYIGSGRPILIVGTTSGIAADLVRDRGLGAAEATPERIAERLREWLREKREFGRISLPRRSEVGDLTRESQTRVLSEALHTAARTPRVAYKRPQRGGKFATQGTE